MEERVRHRLIDGSKDGPPSLPPLPRGACLTTTVYFYLQRYARLSISPGTRHEPRGLESYAAILHPINNRREHLTVVVIPAMLLTLNRAWYILAHGPAKIVFSPLFRRDSLAEGALRESLSCLILHPLRSCWVKRKDDEVYY